jgi:ATP/maltotriose-dependent transcriptional regulator MalT
MSPMSRPPRRHTGPVASRVTSSRMIGRAAELQQLEDALAAASSGRSSLAFVAGDSGVGKTRLVGELLRRAEASGAEVLSGDAVELGEGELPYAALVSALRGLARDGHPALDALHPRDRAELARLLPGLAGAAPATDPSASDTPAQGRLFEAVLGLLDRLGADAPVVLALEDLHWADPSTRAFVAFLARSLCRERVLVVLTYRLDELHRRHPLRPLLAEIERDPAVHRITLAPLTRDELAVALEDILGAAPDPDLLDRLYARSEGNPLFMEELLAAGVDGRGALPATLRDALMVRIEQLAETTQDVLRIIAVGQQVDHATLAEVSGLDRAALVSALREAVASHLVVAQPDDRYAFRHALLREVVADDLLPGERIELHRAFAGALEGRSADGPAGAQLAAGIAHHYAAAGDQRAALGASVRAGRAAEAVHAFGEAALLFERALELWDRVPDAEDVAGMDEVALLHRAGDAFIAAGDRTRPTPLLRAALEMVDAEAEPRRAAALLERLAMAHWRAGRPREGLDTAERALALVEHGEPTPERATIYAWWAKTRMLQGRYRDATEAARKAIEAAEATGNLAALSGALNGMGTSLAAQGAVEEGTAALRRAIDIARELDRPRELESAQINLADALHLAGRDREALEVARVARAESPGRGNHGAWLDVTSAEMLVELGEWAEAERLLPDESRRFLGSELVYVELIRTELLLGRGRHDDVAAHLARLADPVGASAEPQWHGAYGALLAELRRRQGDLDGARAAVDDALDRIEFCTEDASRLARVSAVGVTVEADRAQRGRDLGDDAEVARALGDIEAYVMRVEAAAEVSGMPVEAAWLATARADAARAAGEPAADLWRAAAAAWEAVERPYRVTVARWREAEAAVAADDRETAARAAGAALETARRLGAGWLAGEIEGLIARARLRLDDGDARSAAGATAGGAVGADDAPPPADDPFGLTPRERQVLALVARGATNRQIGAQLYMAEKTASVHVSRILAKLDVRSRTEAAAVAYRLGLAD